MHVTMMNLTQTSIKLCMETNSSAYS